MLDLNGFFRVRTWDTNNKPLDKLGITFEATSSIGASSAKTHKPLFLNQFKQKNSIQKPNSCPRFASHAIDPRLQKNAGGKAKSEPNTRVYSQWFLSRNAGWVKVFTEFIHRFQSCIVIKPRMNTIPRRVSTVFGKFLPFFWNFSAVWAWLTHKIAELQKTRGIAQSVNLRSLFFIINHWFTKDFINV